MTERWHRRCTTVTPRRRTGPCGGGGADEGVPVAQCLGGASASAWRVNAAAVRLLCRRRVGVGRWGRRGGCWGRAGACGGNRTPVTKIGRRPHGHVHAGLGMSRACLQRHQHRSPSSLVQMESGSRHSAPKTKVYNFAEQTFCKFESWSDQNFQKTVLAKTRVYCLEGYMMLNGSTLFS